MSTFPLEIIEKNFMLLSPKRCFIVCSRLCLTICYRHCISLIPHMSVNDAIRRGLISLLEWWNSSGLFLKYHQDATGLPLEYNESALHYASANCHVAVLEWWKQSGLIRTYPETVFFASGDICQIAVLEWWTLSGQKINAKLL